MIEKLNNVGYIFNDVAMLRQPNNTEIMSKINEIIDYLNEQWENEQEKFFIDGKRVTQKEYELAVTPASQDKELKD